jgi:hypothetical protein
LINFDVFRIISSSTKLSVEIFSIFYIYNWAIKNVNLWTRFFCFFSRRSKKLLKKSKSHTDRPTQKTTSWTKSLGEFLKNKINKPRETSHLEYQTKWQTLTVFPIHFSNLFQQIMNNLFFSFSEKNLFIPPAGSVLCKYSVESVDYL